NQAGKQQVPFTLDGLSLCVIGAPWIRFRVYRNQSGGQSPRELRQMTAKVVVAANVARQSRATNSVPALRTVQLEHTHLAPFTCRSLSVGRTRVHCYCCSVYVALSRLHVASDTDAQLM